MGIKHIKYLQFGKKTTQNITPSIDKYRAF